MRKFPHQRGLSLPSQPREMKSSWSETRPQSESFIVEPLNVDISLSRKKCTATYTLWANYTYTKFDFSSFTCDCFFFVFLEPPVHFMQINSCDFLGSCKLTMNLSCISAAPGTDHEPGNSTFLLWTHGWVSYTFTPVRMLWISVVNNTSSDFINSKCCGNLVEILL